MRRALLATASTLATTAVISFAAPAAAASCDSLSGKSFGAASVAAATAITPPFSAANLDPPGPVPVNALFCRVEGVIKPTADSDIKFELWLPPQSSWNKKYEGVGNGGFAGSFIYNSMSWALDAGYAISATDTGHSGGSLDAQWALGHPEKIADFGWRAIHETAVASKAIIDAFYGEGPAHAYFSGCSDGGREALMEAQRFPSDYDGIVAGAPANSWTKLLTAAISDMQALNATPVSWLSPEKLKTVNDAVMAACHGENGVLDNPSECHFDPSSLSCKGDASNACLTEPEIASLRTIYSGPRDSAGKSIFPGFAPGGEAGASAWSLWITGTEPKRTLGSLIYGFGTGFFGNMVYNKPNWDFKSVTIDEGLAQADKMAAEALNAELTDLSAFKAAGGKLLQYHGWNDSAIPPQNSINYYEAVAAKMGGEDNIKPFYRLFLAPGMEHCGGGPGPNAIGGVFGGPSAEHDPQHDVVAALAHWVENGVAPASITATSYHDNDPAKGVAAQRPWCPYPASARYSGKGDRNVAASYSCASDK
jgi:Tannase and feruloyl esterase